MPAHGGGGNWPAPFRRVWSATGKQPWPWPGSCRGGSRTVWSSFCCCRTPARRWQTCPCHPRGPGLHNARPLPSRAATNDNSASHKPHCREPESTTWVSCRCLLSSRAPCPVASIEETLWLPTPTGLWSGRGIPKATGWGAPKRPRPHPANAFVPDRATPRPWMPNDESRFVRQRKWRF